MHETQQRNMTVKKPKKTWDPEVVDVDARGGDRCCLVWNSKLFNFDSVHLNISRFAMLQRKSPKICSKLIFPQGTCCASAAVVSFLSLIVLALLLLGPSHVLFYAGGGFKVGVIVRSSGHDGDGNASLSIRAASEDIAKSIRGLDALQLKPPDLVIQEIRYFL